MGAKSSPVPGSRVPALPAGTDRSGEARATVDREYHTRDEGGLV